MRPRNLMGTLINTSTQTQLTSCGPKYIAHTLTGTSGTGSKSWSNGTAPIASAGDEAFGAFNVNNNSNTSGDIIKLAKLIPEALSNNKDISSFKFSGMNPEVIGIINEADTITLTIPNGTNVKEFAG